MGTFPRDSIQIEVQGRRRVPGIASPKPRTDSKETCADRQASCPHIPQHLSWTRSSPRRLFCLGLNLFESEGKQHHSKAMRRAWGGRWAPVAVAAAAFLCCTSALIASAEHNAPRAAWADADFVLRAPCAASGNTIPRPRRCAPAPCGAVCVNPFVWVSLKCCFAC